MDHLWRWVQTLGAWAYLVAAIFAFCESLIISYLVPGVIVMAFAGFLCYSGVYSLSSMIVAAFIGHFIGEMVNYFIGHHRGRTLFQEHHRYLHLDLLETVERRFHENALYIMAVGQFVGALRPLVSLAAGVIRFPLYRYIPVMLVLDFLWAFVHVGIGYLLGASWATAPHVLGRFALLIVLAVVLFAVGRWLVFLSNAPRGTFRRQRFKARQRIRHPKLWMKLILHRLHNVKLRHPHRPRLFRMRKSH
jgi:membrane protein DedA with SNARE-associated domain